MTFFVDSIVYIQEEIRCFKTLFQEDSVMRKQIADQLKVAFWIALLSCALDSVFIVLFKYMGNYLTTFIGGDAAFVMGIIFAVMILAGMENYRYESGAMFALTLQFPIMSVVLLPAIYKLISTVAFPANLFPVGILILVFIGSVIAFLNGIHLFEEDEDAHESAVLIPLLSTMALLRVMDIQLSAWEWITPIAMCASLSFAVFWVADRREKDEPEIFAGFSGACFIVGVIFLDASTTFNWWAISFLYMCLILVFSSLRSWSYSKKRNSRGEIPAS